MQRLLLALLLLAPTALTAQDNPNYDPDYDGDGCYSVNDILGLLPLFGSCAPFSCGDSVLFDNYWYETVLIGDQCWFAENLRTTMYANGDLIPAGLTDAEWTSATSGATAVYGEGCSFCEHNSPDFDACNDALSLVEYSRLYNGYAVDDARSLCPSGWHVPTVGEWTQLKDYITSQGFAGTEGTALKSTSGWDTLNGTDDFGFSALPGGVRASTNGKFDVAGTLGLWWSSSADVNSADYWFLGPSSAFLPGNAWLEYGHSVRCLMD